MESVYESDSKPSILFSVQQNAKEQHFSSYITCLDSLLGHILFYFVDHILDCHILLYTSWLCLFRPFSGSHLACASLIWGFCDIILPLKLVLLLTSVPLSVLCLGPF